MIRIIFILSIISVLYLNPLLAQDYDPERLEAILETVIQNTEVSPLLDNVEEFIDNPIDLNTCQPEELLQIPAIDETLAKGLVRVVQYSLITDWAIITDSILITPDQLYLLQLCTTLITHEKFDKTEKGKIKTNIRIRSTPQINEVKGFQNGSFKGSPFDLYQRATFESPSIGVGLVMNKDPGEPSIAEFLGGYIDLNLKDTRIVLGDFYMESGMGSIFWKTYGMGKGSETVSPAVETGIGINLSRTHLVFGFFRGAAIQNEFKINNNLNMTFAAFGASTYRSGSIDTSTHTITSVLGSGYFRTESELSRHNDIRELSAGGMAQIQGSFYSFGVSSLYLNYDLPVKSDSKSAFYGKDGTLLSSWAIFRYKNGISSIELSRDARNNIGFKAGSQYRLDDFELAMAYRSFPSDFRSPFGNNFGESSVPSNETGYYTGILWKPINGLQLSAYSDIFRTYSATYTTPVPEHGIDLFSQADIQVTPKSVLITRLRYDNKTTSSVINKDKLVYQRTKLSSRLELDHKATDNINARIRLEFAFINYEHILPEEKGYSGFLEINWNVGSSLVAGGRLSFYSTDSFDSAIYEFDSNLPGYFTSAVMYGSGSRSCVYLKWLPIDKIVLSMRYSELLRNWVDRLGSGLTEIEGNTDRKIYVQVDVSL
jgi:hypothetical protein